MSRPVVVAVVAGADLVDERAVVRRGQLARDGLLHVEALAEDERLRRRSLRRTVARVRRHLVERAERADPRAGRTRPRQQLVVVLATSATGVSSSARSSRPAARSGSARGGRGLLLAGSLCAAGTTWPSPKPAIRPAAAATVTQRRTCEWPLMTARAAFGKAMTRAGRSSVSRRRAICACCSGEALGREGVVRFGAELVADAQQPAVELGVARAAGRRSRRDAGGRRRWSRGARTAGHSR